MTLDVEERISFPVLSTVAPQWLWARQELADAIVERDGRVNEERDAPPEKEPAMSPSIPGRVYDNPNDGEEYEPPNVDEERAFGEGFDYEDDDEEDDEDDDSPDADEDEVDD